MNSIQKFAVTSASVVLSLAAFTPAQAATVTYDIDVSIDTGPLSGETLTGSLSFDDSALSGSGSEFLPLSDFAFSNFTEADDPTAGVNFSDGNFLGLSFSVSTLVTFFSFVPGFSSIDEAFFAYSTPSGDGAGDVTYDLVPGQTQIPEPASGLGLLALGILGTASRLKRKQ